MKSFRILLPVMFLVATLPGFGLDPTFLEPVQPISPALKAQGGTSTANAEGFDALFANPAAFSNPKASLTLLSFETTAHVPLSGIRQIVDKRDSWGQYGKLLEAEGKPMLTLLNDILTTTGLGEEASVRMGWVGNNLGVGLVVQQRLMAAGSDILSTKVAFDQTTAGVIGIGWPFDVGLGTLSLGGDLRPMQRALATLTFSDLLSNGLNVDGYTILSGFGLGWDIGMRWDYAGFRTGLVVRDIGSTTMNFRSYGVQEWIKGFSFPSGGTAVSTLYSVPTVIGLGTAWTPDVGSLANMFQPQLSFDLQIPIKGQHTEPSFWTWTHLGAEALFLKFLAVRAGLNQGYFTFGLGAKLFITDFNLAIYSDELGLNSGLQRRPAVSFEAVVHL